MHQGGVLEYTTGADNLCVGVRSQSITEYAMMIVSKAFVVEMDAACSSPTVD